jgi:hypothetical protein
MHMVCTLKWPQVQVALLVVLSGCMPASVHYVILSYLCFKIWHPQVSLQNVEASYINPSVLDTCEEYTGRQIMALQASLGDKAVIPLSGTAVSLTGPVTITVLVSGGDTQRTGAQV